MVNDVTSSCHKEREELWEASRHLFGYLMSLKEVSLEGSISVKSFQGLE